MKRTWYLAALVPLAIGVAAALVSISRVTENIATMQRMVAPGERSFVLNAGSYVVFGETDSIVNDTAYHNEQLSVSCSLAREDGTKVALERPTAKTTYSLGGYAGSGIFEFALASPATVKLSCTTEAGKAVLAIGGGVGAAIVVGLISGLFGFFGAGGVFLVVFIKRRRWLRSRATAASAPAPR